MMRRVLMILGVLIALMPYLGFPESFAGIFYTIAGMIVTFLAWNLKEEQISLAELEVLEEELNTIAEDHSHAEEVQVAHAETGSVSVVTSAPFDVPASLSTEKPVEVSFEKRKQRNLKKRITREETEPTVVDAPLP